MRQTRVRTLAAVALLTAGLAACKPEENKPQTQPEPETTAFDSDGATRSHFSVSETKQVCFSRGNLQHQASSGTWQFAEHQYDVVGDGNGYIAEGYDGWIDLFGWGTSGWASGANEYQPWATSTTNTDYQPGADWHNNLTGDCVQADWGMHNAIANGGGQSGMWRTLSSMEWHYLTGDSPKRAGKWGRATVGTMTGMVLLPDEWTSPEGLEFNAVGSSYRANSYTLEEWEEMENAGAVFLPTAGYRQWTMVAFTGQWGAYWSTTRYDADRAICFLFSNSEFYPMDGDARCAGMAVRLVKDL